MRTVCRNKDIFKMFKFLLFICFVSVVYSDDVTPQTQQQRAKGATLKPLSACCDIPELGDPQPLTDCSNPKKPGPCNDIQCVFEKSGFLVNNQTLDKDAYRNHLRQWAKKQTQKGWSEAVDKAIYDCVDKDLRQYLDYPCKAYDVFACTGIAMLKKCPKEAWKC